MPELKPCPYGDCYYVGHHWHDAYGYEVRTPAHPAGDEICAWGTPCYTTRAVEPSPEPLLGVTTVALMIEAAVRQAEAKAAANAWPEPGNATEPYPIAQSIESVLNDWGGEDVMIDGKAFPYALAYNEGVLPRRPFSNHPDETWEIVTLDLLVSNKSLTAA